MRTASTSLTFTPAPSAQSNAHLEVPPMKNLMQCTVNHHVNNKKKRNKARKLILIRTKYL